ncbi:MAG: tetratricopeptide repeat protein [Gemmatimonadaceae bacterium]|nr:tetratricopeptide repeat protein [Gemmatimonadaceae bacterium]
MSQDSSLDTDRWVDFFRQNSRNLSIAAIVLVAGGGAGYLWNRSAQIKADRADAAFAEAARAFDAGNAALAEKELGKVALRYAGTSGGAEASMLLAQVLFDQGKYADGLKALEGTKVPKHFQSGVHALIAAAHQDQGKHEEAAKHYGMAAEAAELSGDRDYMKAEQARALVAAGKKAEAEKIWAALAANEESSVAAEARVRLGELTAKSN